MQRLRFKNLGGGHLKLDNVFALTEYVSVEVNLNKLSYSILSDTGKVRHNGTSQNKVELFKDVKTVLKSFGVKINDEVRQKRTKVRQLNDDKYVGGSHDTDSNDLSNNLLVGSVRD